MTALEKLKELASLFEREGIDDAAREAALLLTEILHISKTSLHSSPPDISKAECDKIDSLAARRVLGEPLQYIIGHVEFWGLKIHVGKGVLIPRPETELLVEEAIKIIGTRHDFSVGAYSNTPLHMKPTILDLCTGSGCIALALAKEYAGADIYGVDKSAIALPYARKNAAYNGILNVNFIEGDLFASIRPDARFYCIVSNPPYIRRDDIQRLQREISFEPVAALDGGEDGLTFYRRILKQAPHHLKDNGVIILEIGLGQADDIRQIAARHGFRDIRFVKDYAGIDRILVGRFYLAV
ncbi:MAG TPA: peptide chain release factor N(5)-glutamine methyltransferase [Dissulfurispiraceae bacterium]|nr:peptide chain release factor N(5)-glutamine methyltransferase [Dissulfurispiraceae bacterium]